jgi:Ribbon-helix-helix protein, copG family
MRNKYREVAAMTDEVHGHTASGRPVTEAEVEAAAQEAEAGYDVDRLLGRRGKRGRPSLGSAPAGVESVRIEPELRRRLLERAEADGTTPSEIIREALRLFLEAS